MLAVGLTGESGWSVPFSLGLTGSSSWTQQILEIGLSGSSSWGISLEIGLTGQSVWLQKSAADYRGTGGLYTRPAGVAANPYQYVKPAPEIIVKCGAVTIPALKGQIVLSRNQAIDWSIEFDMVDDEFGPTSDPAEAVKNKDATWSIIFILAEERFEFTHLIGESYRISDDGRVTVKGTDITERLKATDFMSDVDCSTVQAVFLEMQAKYLVGFIIEFDALLDYAHRFGKPIEWLDLFTKPLADWAVEGNQIRIFPVEYGKAPRWSFVERESMEVLDYQATPWAIRNSATVTKEVGGMGLLLEVHESAQNQFVGAGFFGSKGPYQLSAPARHVQALVIEAKRGSISGFRYLDGGGILTLGPNTSTGRYTGNKPVESVEFNYVPGDPEVFLNGVFQPEIHVIFRGITAERAQCNGGQGGEWDKTVSIPSGKVTPFEAPFVFQHWSAQVGQALADALAYEGALRGETVNWSDELSPWVKPGFNVSLTERKRTGYTNKAVFVQSLTHTWDHELDEETTEIRDSGTTSFDGSALIS